MKGILLALSLLPLASCTTLLGVRYGSNQDSYADYSGSPPEKFDVGPVAKQSTLGPVANVEHDQFAAATTYTVAPAIQQPMSGEDTIVKSWGRIVVALGATKGDGNDPLTVAAGVSFQHRRKTWFFPSTAADENGRTLDMRKTGSDVDCSGGGCAYDEQVLVMLNESDVRRAAAAGSSYRFKVYGKGVSEIVELPNRYLAALVSRLPAQQVPVRRRRA